MHFTRQLDIIEQTESKRGRWTTQGRRQYRYRPAFMIGNDLSGQRQDRAHRDHEAFELSPIHHIASEKDHPGWSVLLQPVLLRWGQTRARQPYHETARQLGNIRQLDLPLERLR